MYNMIMPLTWKYSMIRFMLLYMVVDIVRIGAFLAPAQMDAGSATRSSVIFLGPFGFFSGGGGSQSTIPKSTAER
jgi:hypothetical protein